MEYYKKYLCNTEFTTSLIVGLAMLLASTVVQFFASNYVSYHISDPVTDIILSNTPTYDVDGIFVYGAVFLFFFILFICLYDIKYTPFVMKSIAVFTVIRSVFVSLTHMSPFPNHILISSTFFSKTIFSGIFNYNDLFFSGHTGLPFLMALIFWNEKKLRYIFLGFSMMFGIIVLLGHLHYSIDVASAFFITYGIFDICKSLFKYDWQIFNKETAG